MLARHSPEKSGVTFPNASPATLNALRFSSSKQSPLARVPDPQTGLLFPEPGQSVPSGQAATEVQLQPRGPGLATETST